MRSLLLLTILFSSLTTAGVNAEPANDDIRFVANSASKSPYSTLVEAGGFIFLAGALGVDPETRKLAEGGIEAESHQALENIKVTLTKESVSMSRIVKCTVILADMADWPALNKVYAQFFDGNYPARTAFAASGLGLNARVEIECIAKR